MRKGARVSGGAGERLAVDPKFSPWRLIAYAATAAPLAVMLLPLNAFLPFFYNKVIGLEAAVVGLALLAARLVHSRRKLSVRKRPRKSEWGGC